MKKMLTFQGVADLFPHATVGDVFRVGYEVGEDGYWRWDRAALERHFLLTFDPTEWVTYSFSENGSINVAVLGEDDALAVTLTPEEAKLVGIRMIGLAHEISVLSAREDGLCIDDLVSLMRRYSVDYSDELAAAMVEAGRKGTDA